MRDENNNLEEVKNVESDKVIGSGHYEEDPFSGDDIPTSAMSKVINIIFAPSKAFAAIKKKPTLLIPIAIIMLAPIAFYLICWNQFEATIIKQMEASFESQGMTMTAESAKIPLMFARISTLIITPIGAIIGLVIQSLYYWIVSKIAKSEMSYKQVLSICAHVGVLGVFTWLLMAVMTTISGEIPLTSVTSAASFLPEEYIGTTLAAIITPIEIIGLWGLCLMYLGFRIVGNLSKKAAGIIVTISLLFSVGVSLATVAFTNLMNSFQM